MNESDRAEWELLRKLQTDLTTRLDRFGLELAAREAQYDSARREVFQLQERHRSLLEERSALQGRLEVLAARLTLPLPAAVAFATPAPVLASAESSALPSSVRGAGAKRVEARVASMDLPPIIPPTPSTQVPLASGSAASARARPVPVEPVRPLETPRVSGPGEKASFEMKLGTYWLVRIGIVMLLTGMVFLGNYAYKTFVGRIGPGGKVALLYGCSAVLLGVGGWLYRRQAVLRNYAQVLFGGGLAGVYFTTYAAHHLAPLRVIESALLDGTLLLAWAGVMAWLADRLKSEVLAVGATGLAFYTSVMTQVGMFTLYSNLLLTSAAVFFLVRNRWATLSFVSLGAAYVGYAFWRFWGPSGWHWASPTEGLWLGTGFLAGYWTVFTAAVFLSKDERWAGAKRVSFLSLNNGAFFALFILTMLNVRQGGFYKFALSYGFVLLALSVLTTRVLPQEKLTRDSYLSQGLLLVTLGWVSWFSGLKLALVLGTESAVLITLERRLANPIFRIGSLLAAGLATVWLALTLEPFARANLIAGTALGAMMIFNACWTRRGEAVETTREGASAPFVVMALVAWGLTTWDNTPLRWVGPVLALETVLFTASWSWLRLRTLTVLGQSYLVVAQFICLRHLLSSPLLPGDLGASFPWWSSAVVIVVSVGLGHWWQRQKTLLVPETISQVLQALNALAATGVLFFLLEPFFGPFAWLGMTSLLALIITGYGLATRAWFLAGAGQLILAASVFEFARQLYGGQAIGRPEWYFALAPVAAVSVLALVARRWLESKPGSGAVWALGPLGLVYRVTAVLISLGWIFRYIPDRHEVWVLALVGGGLFFWGSARGSRESLVTGACYTVVGFLTWWVGSGEAFRLTWPNLLALLFLLAQQQAARRAFGKVVLPESVHTAAMVLANVTLLRFVSRWIATQSGGAYFYLTAAWAGLALAIFGAGFVLRERVYRWVGLAILACALGRVAFYDVWKLETVYRIASFMALGVVLLVLGFIYNKYQDRIRQWL